MTLEMESGWMMEEKRSKILKSQNKSKKRKLALLSECELRMVV
jgi:hypothetical protein